MSKFYRYLKENKDPLSILLSLDKDDEDFSKAQKNLEAKVKSIRKEISNLEERMGIVLHDIESLHNKTYKDNKTKIHYGDDKDVNSRTSTLTIGKINQIKKQKSIDSLIDYYNEMSKLKAAIESALTNDINDLKPNILFSKDSFKYSGMNKYIMRLMNDKNFKFQKYEYKGRKR